MENIKKYEKATIESVRLMYFRFQGSGILLFAKITNKSSIGMYFLCAF